MIDPLLILLLGLVTVIGLIVGLRLHPFLALIAGALVVSFASPAAPEAALYVGGGFGADWGGKFFRVAETFGVMAGKVGILIALGAIIGECLTQSGAAERIVLVFCRLFGVKRLPAALMSSGFFLSIPIFYDVTFYLLLPLAKTVYRMTKRHYMLYLLAIGFGATLSHTLVPPTPGPLVVAGELGLSIGSVMLVGALVGIFTIPFALGIAFLIDRRTPNPEFSGDEGAPFEGENAENGLASENALDSKNGGALSLDSILAGKRESGEKLPSFFVSILPLLLPIVLIAASAILNVLTRNGGIVWEKSLLPLKNGLFFLGDAQVALALSALSSALILKRSKRLSLRGIEKTIQTALFGAGVIILITSAGGAFGGMLRASGVGERIETLISGGSAVTGSMTLLLAFAVTAVIKTAQGSSTTAMITAAGIFAAMNLDAATLGFHPAYLAAAIGSGSAVTGWMNDSGFCIFAGMSGITETCALKTWTVGLVLLGCSAMLVILVLARLLPMTGV